MIAPLAEADVDIFIVLAPKYFEQEGQTSLLEKVKQALKKTYKTPDISRNGHAVTIVFSDFKVDVVPGFNRKGGGFLIPDSISKRWISTDPQKHVELWSVSNKNHSGDLIPLIKMIKGWNKSHSALLRSFHLECMVRDALASVTISNFPSGVRYAIEKVKAKVYVQVPDPSGYDGDVGAYLVGSELTDAAKLLETAYNYAIEAERLETAGKTEKAFDYWRAVFPDCFPAY